MTRRAFLIAPWLITCACPGLASTLIGRAADAGGNAVRDLRLLLPNLETVRKQSPTDRVEIDLGTPFILTVNEDRTSRESDTWRGSRRSYR